MKLTYKAFTGTATYIEEDNIWRGHITDYAHRTYMSPTESGLYIAFIAACDVLEGK